MYDEGAVYKDNSGLTEAQYMNQVQADLAYAEEKYFSSSAYLKIDDKPVLFVFSYHAVDEQLDWKDLRNMLERYYHTS
ncbi:MAG: hypothetical protein D3908_15270 [Candidatus Electrothrix sp. AUS4]|nr:hypothetical protein [Candidatus Electrothrix sp. AUS4]